MKTIGKDKYNPNVARIKPALEGTGVPAGSVYHNAWVGVQLDCQGKLRERQAAWHTAYDGSHA